MLTARGHRAYTRADRAQHAVAAGSAATLRSSNRPSPPLRYLIPFVVVVAAAVTYVYRRRERRLWASRRLSGGRKALVLNLIDRN